MHQLDCNGRIATIHTEPRWAEERIAQPAPSPEKKGNPRNRMTREQWVAYLRKVGKVTVSEPADMEPQGMVPFGQYPNHRPKKKISEP